MSVLCPICASALAEKECLCKNCGAELSLYRSLFYAPDLLYNEAAELMKEKEFSTAYDKLAAAHYLRPSDVGIMTAMAECAESMKDYLNAMEKTAMAIAESDDPQLVQNYERLSKLFREQEEKKQSDKEEREKMHQELKEVVHDVLREMVVDLMKAALVTSKRKHGS